MGRISSLEQYLANVGGYPAFIWEDMAEETTALFQELLNQGPQPDLALAVVTEKFNNGESAKAIIYHLRLLAASYLKENAATYEGFIPDGRGITGYCQETIESVDREIDHLGVILLYNILLKPAGFVLEIAYLDRSEGEQVNTHRLPGPMDPQDPSTLGPAAYLLYRPDHYDILYKPQQPTMDVQVNRAAFAHQIPIASSPHSMQTISSVEVDMTALTMLPGFGGTTGLSPLAGAGAPSPIDDGYTPSPQSPWMAQPQFPEAYPQGHGLSMLPQVPQQQQPPSRIETSHPLRFSRWQYPELMENAPLPPEPTFMTQSFKNSHFNTAHYNNPNFQPEEYRPDEEYQEALPNRRKKPSKNDG
jgi:ubiquitin thioesterase protein OTUB1